MSDDKALIPIEEQKVDFYGDEIVAVSLEIDGQHKVYVPLRPICEYLGLSWSSQLQKLREDEVLSEGLSSVLLSNTEGRQRYAVICLQLELLPGWLFSLNPKRVRADLQDKIKRYRRDCYRVLWEVFNMQAPPTQDLEQTQSTLALEQIRATALAVAQLAEQQIEMERRLTKRLDKAAEVFTSFDRRLGTLEQKLSPAAHVTEEQAEVISSTVKALAELMASKDSSKNHYQGIFAELYRRFRVSSYKNIRIEQYEKVLQFLEDWRATQAG